MKEERGGVCAFPPPSTTLRTSQNTNTEGEHHSRGTREHRKDLACPQRGQTGLPMLNEEPDEGEQSVEGTGRGLSNDKRLNEGGETEARP